MHRPYQYASNEELGSQFAAAVKLGGRPIIRRGEQYAYADLALEVILDEFRLRSYAEDEPNDEDPIVALDNVDAPF